MQSHTFKTIEFQINRVRVAKTLIEQVEVLVSYKENLLGQTVNLISLTLEKAPTKIEAT
jgi:hypothetical protein